jgi:cation diffusion facilitator family transporter
MTIHAQPQSTPAAPPPRVLRLALIGLLVNFGLTAVKLTAGLLGNSYALIADAIESLSDIVGSAIIWGGLLISARPASERHPYGYGKAESLAAVVVAAMVLLAGLGIAVEAVREIITPHHTPKPFTLAVLAAAIVAKETLFRIVNRAARASGSAAVETDAWHHRADAITSAAAFVGIAIAVIGKHITKSDRFAPADDWAALFAACIIFYNATRLMVKPIRELLDVQSQPTVDQARTIAAAVPGIVHVEKVFSRKSGTGYWLDMHVWVDGSTTVHEAHALAHTIKDAVRRANPRVIDVLIHVEPARPDKGPTPA